MFLSLLDLVRQSGALLSNPLAGAAPSLEVADLGDALQVTARLAGYDPRTIQIQLGETSLAIGGQSTREEKTEGPDFCRTQSSRSSFYRTLPLPARIDPRRAQSQWESDVTLVITLPKR